MDEFGSLLRDYPLDPSPASGVETALTARLRSVRALFRPTPIHRIELEHADVHAKLEFHNPVGSLKDRPAYFILADGIKKGLIRPTTTIIESSSGNFACSLAVFCRLLGLPFIAVVDPRIARHYRDLLETTCTRVEVVSEHDDTGGFLKTRLAAVQRLREEIPDSFWPNQYGNPAGAEAHFATTGPELLSAVPDLDYLFVAVSSAGTIAGVSRFLATARPSCKIIAVDAEGSVIFGGTAKKRYIPGMGSSVVPDQLEAARYDAVVAMPETESVRACGDLLEEHGLFVGGSSGACFAAIQRYSSSWAESGVRPSVAFFCADRGTAYLDTIYNEEWVDALRTKSLRTIVPPSKF